MTLGWKIEPACRERLLALFPPRYERTVADHVTRAFAHSPDASPPPGIAHARVVGHVDDGSGVEALVVAIDGCTARPDGGTWHVTWSLAGERAAKDSNVVLAEQGWSPCEGGTILLRPAVW